MSADVGPHSTTVSIPHLGETGMCFSEVSCSSKMTGPYFEVSSLRVSSSYGPVSTLMMKIAVNSKGFSFSHVPSKDFAPRVSHAPLLWMHRTLPRE